MESGNSELRDFYNFLGEIINRGQPYPSAEATVTMWRKLHPKPIDRLDPDKPDQKVST